MIIQVTIPECEYNRLLDRDRWLSALEAAGIDNTDAYDFAFEILGEWDEESTDD